MTTTSTQAGEGAASAPRQAGAGAGGSGFTGKRQLRNFLLDRMQLRYTAVIVLVSALLTLGLGYWVVKKTHEASETVKVTLLEKADDPATLEQIKSSFETGDRIILLALVAFGVVLCVTLTLYGIVITHKVAGPLYKISNYFASVRDGRLGPVYNLRRGDQLQEFFEHFKEMHGALRTRTQAEVAELAGIIAGLEAAHLSGEAQKQLDALKALKRKKEESLA
ncbi:MAG TPA: hypothetical protein VKN99_00400 [Polyangia bacterium]|nr:hypothetical protein [Polyangia bacterium]